MGNAIAKTPGHHFRRRLVQATNEAGTRPQIMDAVRDQNGECWIRYGSHDGAAWIAVAELITAPSAVYRRLSATGSLLLTPASQTAFKREIESHSDYRPGLVAARPGWIEGFYAYGDGVFEFPLLDQREPIVAFAPDPKFTPRGALSQWQAAVGPFVTNQPLLYFLIALPLTGPLARFAPSGYPNPQVEIVGPGEAGKTIAGMLAASVWAGDPESAVGGGDTSDLTLNALDDLKFARRDGFMLLDEGNLAAASAIQRRDFAQHSVSSLARREASGGWAIRS